MANEGEADAEKVPLRRRDPELVRLVLENAEFGGDGKTPFGERYDKETVRHHRRILLEAGYIVERAMHDGGPECIRLTWNGHDYLDGLRGTPRPSSQGASPAGGDAEP